MAETPPSVPASDRARELAGAEEAVRVYMERHGDDNFELVLEARAQRIEELELQLAQAGAALRKVGKAALVVRPTLMKPYPDAPDTNPWKRFMGKPASDAYNLGCEIRDRLRRSGGPNV